MNRRRMLREMLQLLLLSFIVLVAACAEVVQFLDKQMELNFGYVK